MDRVLSWGITIAVAVALGAISVCYPGVLSDAGNGFLADFVNHELLAFLGVVVTITLASAAGLHLELNKLEDASDRKFPKTRNSVRISAYSLIALLFVGFLIVLTKPMVGSSLTLASVWNSAAIVVIVFNVFVLVDLTRTVLAIPAVSEVNVNKSKTPKSLKEAIQKGELEAFIKQHSADPLGDMELLNKALKRPASRKSKEAPKASSRRGPAD